MKTIKMVEGNGGVTTWPEMSNQDVTLIVEAVTEGVGFSFEYKSQTIVFGPQVIKGVVVREA